MLPRRYIYLPIQLLQAIIPFTRVNDLYLVSWALYMRYIHHKHKLFADIIRNGEFSAVVSVYRTNECIHFQSSKKTIGWRQLLRELSPRVRWIYFWHIIWSLFYLFDLNVMICDTLQQKQVIIHTYLIIRSNCTSKKVSYVSNDHSFKYKITHVN